MNAIRKGQIENIMKGDVLGQRDFIHMSSRKGASLIRRVVDNPS